MVFLSFIFVVVGLCLFEVISSIDNAIINAQVLSGMGQKAQKWFLWWGMLIAVVFVRGLLPWLILWAVNPALGPVGAFTLSFSGDARVKSSVEGFAPVLFIGGGIFLIFLFFHWLFLEEKQFGIFGEKFFYTNGVWFYAVSSIILALVVWLANHVNPIMGFSAVVGSTAFFITHGFKEQAAIQEKRLLDKGIGDLSKLFFLEVIDATFSIDGVLGAFAFTLSVPLILLGNGLGAFVVRQLTMVNMERIKTYAYLKNGAMYSILILGIIMISASFGIQIPSWFSPLITIMIVGFFFIKSVKHSPINP